MSTKLCVCLSTNSVVYDFVSIFEIILPIIVGLCVWLFESKSKICAKCKQNQCFFSRSHYPYLNTFVMTSLNGTQI